MHCSFLLFLLFLLFSRIALVKRACVAEDSLTQTLSNLTGPLGLARLASAFPCLVSQVRLHRHFQHLRCDPWLSLSLFSHFAF
ncbi:hypothetical protein M422DRAFT_26447 [Sphaerobolus stellatus SS14]|nr:hypothetical protein M422DRAFT_26447 [Sphaerobolus stellatus SS14]